MARIFRKLLASVLVASVFVGAGGVVILYSYPLIAAQYRQAQRGMSRAADCFGKQVCSAVSILNGCNSGCRCDDKDEKS
jgi:hypothetical protein